MKGGAIPFSEFAPSNILDNLTHGFKSSLSGGYLSDHPQHVPNNLPHHVNSSVTHQPYLEGGENAPVAVGGTRLMFILAKYNVIFFKATI